MNPSIQQFFVERPRIDLLLQEAIKRPVVTVTAAAGYGKTHAVYSFIHRHPFALVWIAFTPRDNAEDQFWEDFTAAMRELSEETAGALAEIGFPSTDRKFDRYMRIPLKDVEPGTKYIIVFDDFHLIHNKDVLRFIERSITSVFPNITSILINRTAIPLNLISLEAKGLLAQITQEDLKFSRDEMRDYFTLRNIDPPEQKAEAVYNTTEGWAFAIKLAGEILVREQALDWELGEYGPNAFKSNIFSLIEKEIISIVSPELKKFLVKLSLIDIHQADLLREIGSPELLGELGSIGAFINLDTYTHIYRIHPLLLEYLSGLSDELEKKEKEEVYLKAAKWSFDKGQKLNAIGYYDKAGDYAELFKVMYTMPFIMDERTATTLLAIMLRVPPFLYDENPIAWTIRIRLYNNLGRLEETETELPDIIKKLEARDDAITNPVVARALTGLYNLWGFKGNMVSHSTGDYGFSACFEKACAYFKTSGHVVGPPVSVYGIGSYLCRVGLQHPNMESYFNAMELCAASLAYTMGGCASGLDDLTRAEFAFFEGDLFRAEELSYRVIKKARDTAQYEIENRAYFFLLRIGLHTGDAVLIKNILKEMEKQLSEPYYSNRYIYHDIVTGWFYVQIGQQGKIAPWLKNNFEKNDLNSVVLGQERLVKAKYHFVSREYPLALACLQDNGGQFALKTFLLGQIETGALEAVCRYKSGDKETSFEILKETCEAASGDGLYMPFTELGRDMRTLTAAALEETKVPFNRVILERIHLSASAYAKRLALVEKEFQSETEQQKTPYEPLSPRERKTLWGLYHGLTGEEIAQETDLSINTVKSITKRIYQKLGAANKADAIRIALEQNILGTGLPLKTGKEQRLLLSSRKGS